MTLYEDVNTILDDYISAKQTIKKRTELLRDKHGKSRHDIVKAVRKCEATPEFIVFAKKIDYMNKFQAEYVESLLDALSIADKAIGDIFQLVVENEGK